MARARRKKDEPHPRKTESRREGPGGHPAGPRQRESRGRPRRARITARRLRDAASRLGGGALGGARRRERRRRGRSRISWRSSASPTTPRLPESARALREEGVDVRRAESTPDAADMDLGAHVLGFARAWAASERGGADVSEPPPFVTPRAPPRRAPPRARAVSALARRVLLTARTTPPAESLAAAALARAASETERAAFEHFAATTFARYDAQSNAVPPKAALFVVTSDNDVVPAVSFARRKCGVRVVACGDFLPKARLEGGGAQASKRRRAASRRFSSTRLKRRNEVGVTYSTGPSCRPPPARGRWAGYSPPRRTPAGLGLDHAFGVNERRQGVVGVWRSGGNGGGRTLAFALAGDSARRPLNQRARVSINQYLLRSINQYLSFVPASLIAVCVRTRLVALFAWRAPATAGGSLPCPSSARP